MNVQRPATGSGPLPTRSFSVGRAFMTTMSTSGVTILLALVSGILTARFLGSDGRGVVSAVSSWTLTLTWASNLGFADAMVYFQSRGADRSTVLGTTLAMVPVLGVLGVGVAQFLVPFGFAAQSEETRAIARVFLCAIPVVLATEAMWSMLVAQHRFAFLGVVRIAQPGAYVLVLLALLAVDHFTPVAVLTAQVGSYALALVIALGGLLAQGPARPDRQLARRGLGYGLRLQGVNLASLRLDLLLLPAFVGASQIGYYSIAVNVTSMVVSLFGSVAMVIFPITAAGDEVGAGRVLERGLRLTLVGGGAAVLVLAVLAPWLIPFVYGQTFAPSVLPLWILLPGVLMCSANLSLTAGLQGHGRPGRASLIQLGSMIFLVVGLIVTVPRHGLVAAALMSSVTFFLVFMLSHWSLSRHGQVSLRRTLALSALASDTGWLVARLRAMTGRRT